MLRFIVRAAFAISLLLPAFAAGQQVPGGSISNPRPLTGQTVIQALGYTPLQYTSPLPATLPLQTVNGASKVYSAADFYWKTRRGNSGAAMSDTLPPASTPGLVNGTRLNIVNIDSSASITVSAGSGTTIAGGASYVISAGRDLMWVFDKSASVWRPDANTGTALLGPNNLSDLASVSAARTNLGLTATGADASYAFRSNNLSDLTSLSTARTNLGLGTAATQASSVFLQASNNLSDVTAATARTNLGVTATGADTGYAFRSNNLSDLASVSAARANLGLGTAATQSSSVFLQASNNLSDVTAATARTNLGLGTAATQASSVFLQASNNLSDLASVSAARTNLGVTATGADTGYAFRSNNLSDLASVTTARTNLGVTASGADTGYAFRSNNLSDLASVTTARTNLGLGTAATQASSVFLQASNNLSDVTAATARTNLGVTASGADTGYAFRSNNLSDLASVTTARTNLKVDQRTAVADLAYTVLSTDYLVAYTSLTAARVVTLPAASSFAAGRRLVLYDESGLVSASLTVSLAPNGADKINGANTTQVALNSAFGRVEMESNGSTGWVIGASARAGDCTTVGLASSLSLVCLKTNGVSFGAFATGTDAGNLTGTVSINRFNSGTSASSATFLRGDGIWAAPTITGAVNQSTTGPTTCAGFPGATCPTSGTAATYTTPASVKWIEIRVVGGGSGGAGGQNSTASTSGGNTSFGSITANGGSGNSYTVTGALATASGGDINYAGSAGGTAAFAVSGSNSSAGGAGAPSVLGGGGAAAYQTAGSNAGANTGAGGGGGGCGAVFGLAGVGGNSGAYAEKIIASPSATYTFTIGTGGAGAAAGGSCYQGGNGASGAIIVKEHYNF
jgi:hypothetical protein